MIIMKQTAKKVAEFKSWLTLRDCTFPELTNEFELLRWTHIVGVVRILYTNKQGTLGRFNSPGAAADWGAFRESGVPSGKLATPDTHERAQGLLRQFSDRAPFLAVDLPWLSQLAVEAKKLLGEAP